MNNISKLDKALTLLRQLDFDHAIKLFFEILQDTPKDLELIKRIYLLVIKKPQSQEYQKICFHIFNLKSHTEEIHQLIVQCYIDFTKLIKNEHLFSKDEVFNLFEHLIDSHLTFDTEKFRQLIKKSYAEEDETPVLLMRDCEELIKKKKIILAKDELKYLTAYYAETDAGRWALVQLKNMN